MPGKSAGYVVMKKSFAELINDVIFESSINGFGPYNRAAKKARQIKTNVNLIRRKLLFRLAAFSLFFLFILFLSYFLGGQKMSATPISSNYVRVSVLILKGLSRETAQSTSIRLFKT